MTPRRDPAPAGPGNADRAEAWRRRALEMARSRLLAAGLMFLFAFLVVAGRLIDLTVFDQGESRASAATSGARRPRARRHRRSQRRILATSLPTASLYRRPAARSSTSTRPSAIWRRFCPTSIAQALRTALAGRRPLRLDQAEHDAATSKQTVNRLGIPGLDFSTRTAASIRTAALAAHVVGFTNIDGQGIAGIEQSFDAGLAAAASR